MKIKMTAWLWLLSLLCFLLTGCGGSAVAETQTMATETMATTESTTEPTTVPTEPKTFFEEQGFTFWEGFNVYDTLDDEGNRDGGIFAEANILDSAECKVTITSGGREETTYRLADTKVEVVMDEYTLTEFDEACKNDKLLRTENIKNASDSLYKAFAEEDSSLTKNIWLEQYQDYKVIRCQINRTIRTANEVQNAKQAMNIGQSRWEANFYTIFYHLAVMNCMNGNVYVAKLSDFPGVAETFSVETEMETEVMAAVADVDAVWLDSGNGQNYWVLDNFFVMVPENTDNLAFILSFIDTGRSLEDFDANSDRLSEVSEVPWEEMTYAEFIDDDDYVKSFFLSPNHH